MLVSFRLPDSVAQAVALESARRGQTPASWIIARLSDHFGCRHVPTASRVPLIDDESDRTASDPEDRP